MKVHGSKYKPSIFGELKLYTIYDALKFIFLFTMFLIVIIIDYLNTILVITNK